MHKSYFPPPTGRQGLGSFVDFFRRSEFVTCATHGRAYGIDNAPTEHADGHFFEAVNVARVTACDTVQKRANITGTRAVLAF